MVSMLFGPHAGLITLALMLIFAQRLILGACCCYIATCTAGWTLQDCLRCSGRSPAVHGHEPARDEL